MIDRFDGASFGAGFSTSEGVLGDISIRERNLLGRGQDLRIGTVIAQRQQQVDLSFTEPYFLERNLAAGVDLHEFAKSRKFEETAVTLSLLCGLPLDAVERAILEDRPEMVLILARAAGLGGMVGGQMLDLAAEGRFDALPPRLGEQEVKVLQAMKTGALLRFGCLAGAILGKAEIRIWPLGQLGFLGARPTLAAER